MTNINDFFVLLYRCGDVSSQSTYGGQKYGLDVLGHYVSCCDHHLIENNWSPLENSWSPLENINKQGENPCHRHRKDDKAQSPHSTTGNNDDGHDD